MKQKSHRPSVRPGGSRSAMLEAWNAAMRWPIPEFITFIQTETDRRKGVKIDQDTACRFFEFLRGWTPRVVKSDPVEIRTDPAGQHLFKTLRWIMVEGDRFEVPSGEWRE